jgi:hypothetical protein
MKAGPPSGKAGDADLLNKVRVVPLEDLCAQFEWSQATASFVTPRATLRTVLQSLINHAYWFDATTLLAHAMPQREAVWWSACVCREYLDQNAIASPEREEQEGVLSLCRQWVAKPEEDTRVAVYRAALAIPNRAPAHWAGMSVFWATGNLTPDAGVVTPPPPFLYARGISASIDLAANLSAAAREQLYSNALGRGVDIASGGDGSRVIKL